MSKTTANWGSNSVVARFSVFTKDRIQCTGCRAVFTVLPHFVLRYRKMKPEVANKVLLATHGGLSHKLCAVIENVCPMAIYRLVCSIGRNCLVRLGTRCHLPLPQYFIADEKHTHCTNKRVYLPTISCGRVIWHLGYTMSKSVEAFAASKGTLHQSARSPKRVNPSFIPALTTLNFIHEVCRVLEFYFCLFFPPTFF